MKMVSLLEQIVEHPLGIDMTDFEALDARRQLELLHERLVQARLMPPRSRADALLGPVRVFEAALRTQYTPGAVYDAPVHLVLASDASLNHPAAEQKFLENVSAWRRFAPELVSWRSPGNHMTVLKPPSVDALADWLRSGLQD
jgi:thioesterase domain-containing protein